MTLARIQQTGVGILKARLAIQGYAEFVSDATMVKSGARPRYRGLQKSSLKFGSKSDLMRATISADSCTPTILDFGKKATLVFAKRPQLVSYLRANATAADVTINVTDTSGWPSSGVLHMHTEAISYTGKTGTSFTGCTRGVFDTTPQAHYVANGANLAYPRVTDVPESLEGRRVLVYFYGDGDDPQGDGTLVWRGIARTGAKGGKGSYSFTLDPITALLEAELGAGLNEPMPIRGIYYTVVTPFVLVLDLLTTSSTMQATAVVKLTGFYEDQAAFCAAMTNAIATAIAAPFSGTWSWSVGSSIIAQPSSSGGWELVYSVGSGAGTPMAVAVNRTHSYVDFLHETDFRGSTFAWTDDLEVGGSGRALSWAQPPTAGHTYRIPITGMIPRAACGRILAPPFPAPDFDAVDVTDATASTRRIYYDGLLTPTVDMVAWVYENGVDQPGELLGIVSVDTTNRFVEGASVLAHLGNGTRIVFPGALARGSVEDLRQALVANSPAAANLGQMPLITSDDIHPLDVSLVTGSDSTASLGLDRFFLAHPGIQIGNMFSAELLALGLYPRINAGSIEWKRLRGQAATDLAAWTIAEKDIARDDWPTVERGADGIVSTVVYRTGWDPTSDDWKGAAISVRDVESASSTLTALSIEVAQHSYPATRLEGTTTDEFVSYDDVALMATPVLSLFGVEYDRFAVTVGMRYFGVLVGDVVSLTSSKIPKTDGTMGITSQLCLVTGVGYDGSTNRIQLELLSSGQPVAGYAPGFKVTAQSNISGNTWDVTLDLTDYTDATTVARWLAAGDAVRVTQGDATTPTEVLGTVASITSPTVVRVTFGAVWTPGASEWGLRSQDAGAMLSSSSLARFMFVARADAQIHFSDVSKQARVLT